MGLAGERAAAAAVRARGWRLLGRRVKTAWAEIDLVALDGRTLVCAEVKTNVAGSAAIGPPGRSYRRAQRERQVRAARRLSRSLAPGTPWRIDLIEVELDSAGAALGVRIRNTAK